jgi:acyl carrier protein
MITIDDFMTMVRDELGLPLSADDADRHLDEVPDWDSVQLLSLLSLLERNTGRTISMPDVLEASSLNEIYRLAVRP